MTQLLRFLSRPPTYPDANTLIVMPDIIDGRSAIHPRRIIALEGGINFRDMGGYPTHDGRSVRWGRVYRSGSLARLTAKDHEALAALDIKLVCDLRSDDEIRSAPERLDERLHGIGYSHLPTTAEESTLSRLRTLLFNRRKLADMLPRAYTEVMLAKNPQIFRALFEHLANADSLPLLIRCTAGKDRTGMSAALILLALGVDEETVIADYTLSNLYFDDLQAFTRTAIEPLGIFGVSVEDLKPLLLAAPETLRFALDYLRSRYGGVQAYLRDTVGVTDETLDQVRQNLLEDA